MDYDAFAARQVGAGLALVSFSELAWWDVQSRRLAAQDVAIFEQTAEVGYERLKSWILFSVGAEYLVKGLCAFHGVPDAADKPQEAYLRGKGATLRAYFNGTPARLTEVAMRLSLNPSGLIRGCQRLAEIRNRDIHLYVRGVRKANFPNLNQVILPMLSDLLETIEKSTATGQELLRFSQVSPQSGQ